MSFAPRREFESVELGQNSCVFGRVGHTAEMTDKSARRQVRPTSRPKKGASAGTPIATVAPGRRKSLGLATTVAIWVCPEHSERKPETNVPERRSVKLVHINIVARNADALAEFYKDAFGCEDRRPPTTLSGEEVSRGNGLSNSEIYSVWLTLPNFDTPFLEIHEHKDTHDRPRPTLNEPGFGHLSFEVENVRAALAAIIAAGGTALGEITDFGSADIPFLIVYVRDPEGNVLELEQAHYQR